MQIKTYHIDAFSNSIFSGNPAIVYVLEQWLAEPILQAIAREHYLPATVFLVLEQEKISIRWFSPEYEIDLCGHGALAAGYVIFNKLKPNLVSAELKSSVDTLVIRRKDQLIGLKLPIKKDLACITLPLLEAGLGVRPKEVYVYQQERCLAVLDNLEQIKAITPSRSILEKLPYRGVIVTAPGEDCDFVSRVFYPQKATWEDAVTGSSHCLLVPYWAKRFNKAVFHSRQLSPRGGEMFCSLERENIWLYAEARLYMEGIVMLEDLQLVGA